MSLTPAQIKTISQQVYQKFPELKGVNPQIQNQSAPKTVSAADHYLVVFKGRTTQNIVQVVRVTADAKGRVLKMSTAR